MSIQESVDAGLEALETLRSQTTERSFHAALNRTEGRFVEAQQFMELGSSGCAGIALNMGQRELQRLQAAFKEYGPEVMFI